MTRAIVEERDRRGLCASCRHARLIRSSKGSEFTLCQLSVTDSRFRKYPALPVLTCSGYAQLPEPS